MASSTPSQDFVALIRFALVEDSATAALVDDRVRGPFAPRSGEEVREDLFPMIVVDRIGGSAVAGGHLQRAIVHVYTYSRNSQGEAYRVWDTIAPVLRSARLQRSGVSASGWMRQSEEPRSGWNPALSAWYVRTTHMVMMTGLTPP